MQSTNPPQVPAILRPKTSKHVTELAVYSSKQKRPKKQNRRSLARHRKTKKSKIYTPKSKGVCACFEIRSKPNAKKAEMPFGCACRDGRAAVPETSATNGCGIRLGLSERMPSTLIEWSSRLDGLFRRALVVVTLLSCTLGNDPSQMSCIRR